VAVPPPEPGAAGPARCPRCGPPGEPDRDQTLTDAHPAGPPEPVGRELPERVGRFEVRQRLGEGAFGVVYRAYDPQLEREVALKVAKAGAVADARQLDRFLREARSAARLQHQHIVPLFEAGRDGDRPYLASAFIRGRTLEAELAAGPFEPRRAAELVRRLAEALAYAHRQGVVHRDVKPANVLVDEQGEPHLTDFGLAARREGAERLTQDGAVLGTPVYLSPEQAGGRAGAACPASDQYSLGVVLYELLTGQPPFAGPTELLIFHHLNTDPPSPRKANRAVPRDLETVCLKCLAKAPERRYAGCQELADDLRRWLEGEPIRARRPSLRERLAKWRRRRPAAAALAGAGLALLLAAAALGLWYWDRYLRLKVEYYANHVSRYGVKEGVGRLSEAQARRRGLTYKFLLRGG
jgi:serine/threonine protein kinase